MKILSIETSCDESSIAILDVDGELPYPTFKVHSHMIASQASQHAEYGGVFPSVAKREHAKALTPLLEQVLDQAELLQESSKSLSASQESKLHTLLEREPELAKSLIHFFKKYSKPEIDHICVTVGPGLEPALWVGINFAKALSIIWDIPVTPANHMKGHIWSVFANDTQFSLPEITFPLLALLTSGSHTELVLVSSFNEYTKLGQTRDDAVGEAFDKVARMLGFPYPGGPHIEQAAKIFERDSNLHENDITLPRPMINSNSYDFSFSGLKTAVLYTIRDSTYEMSEIAPKIASEFQNAVLEVLSKKTDRAIQEYKPQGLLLAGGVAANTSIQSALESIAQKYELPFFIPPKSLTGDNALMIGVAGALELLNNKTSPDLNKIRADGGLTF